jgi:hypothetical protein
MAASESSIRSRERQELAFGDYKRGAGLTTFPIEDTRRQFYDLKEESRQRLGYSDLQNDVFLQMLLDCWTLHLERDVDDGDHDE